jgi:K+-transporting ATPase KdpF subunit
MSPILILVTPKAFEMNSPTVYAIGAVIALIILVFLAYSLIKPEKF